MQAASRKILAISALAFAAAAGSVAVQAETYDGVLTVDAAASRQDVARGASEAARAGDVYGEAAAAGLSPVPAASVSRADVRRDAVAIARAGNPYGEIAAAASSSPSVGPMPAVAAVRGGSARLN